MKYLWERKVFSLLQLQGLILVCHLLHAADQVSRVVLHYAKHLRHRQTQITDSDPQAY